MLTLSNGHYTQRLTISKRNNDKRNSELVQEVELRIPGNLEFSEAYDKAEEVIADYIANGYGVAEPLRQ